jgi:hypothetical protein
MFVGVFVKLRKATISCVVSVCPSMPPHATTRLLLGRFLMLRIFGNSVERLHGWFKSNKNDGYFKWRHAYIYDNISLSSSHNEKYFRQTCRENQNTQFVLSNSFPNCVVYGIKWKNMVQPCRPRDNITRSILIGCWRTKATDTLRKCHTFCFSTVRMVTRTRLNVPFCVHYLSCYKSQKLTLIWAMQACMDTEGIDTRLGRVSQSTNSQYKALSHVLSCIELH